MEFKIDPAALADIQQEINYYNSKQKGLGKKYHAEVKKFFSAIQKIPFTRPDMKM
ncbi:MAG: hypothetical protein IPM74_19690 [Crocinitomicaceae bacterium]|nr:hypothetical protein [Crocinitomicaceae bacterium]MBK8928056.1 hypothetical protein [Crocinitomicaceae bacterium]